MKERSPAQKRCPSRKLDLCRKPGPVRKVNLYGREVYSAEEMLEAKSRWEQKKGFQHRDDPRRKEEMSLNKEM